MKKSILEIVLLAFALSGLVFDNCLFAQKAAANTKPITQTSVLATLQSTESAVNSKKASVKQPCKVKPYIKSASCTGVNDGAVELEHLSGTPPYTYEWSNGAITKDVSALTIGTYSVKVTDATGCIASLAIEIPAAATFIVKATSTSASSPNSADGNLDIDVEGGVAPFTYLLTDISDPYHVKNIKQSSEKFNGLKKGRYIVNVVDSKGCISSVSLVIKSLDK
jgi:hypothetical protein